jgi:hypothetical protein
MSGQSCGRKFKQSRIAVEEKGTNCLPAAILFAVIGIIVFLAVFAPMFAK